MVKPAFKPGDVAELEFTYHTLPLPIGTLGRIISVGEGEQEGYCKFITSCNTIAIVPFVCLKHWEKNI